LNKQNVIDSLAASWSAAGVNKGDVLLVHSSIKRTLNRYKDDGISITPSDLLESFLQAIGGDGTLLMPLFNFDFPKGVPFDMQGSPSHMGALTEAARAYPNAVRTGHPIYSFAVIGKRAKELAGLENYSGYGDDSPFAFLHRNNAKIGVLDLDDQNSMTFYHYVEECNQVDYRYMKHFEGDYTNFNGETSKRKFGLFVRNIEKCVKTDVNPMQEVLWQKGLYKGERPGVGNGFRTIEASAIFAETDGVIKSGKAQGLLYSIEGDA